MSEKPILFSGEMVKAILEGRKTQTRRVIKLQPPNFATLQMYGEKPSCFYCWDGNMVEVKMPYQSGDILWIRETWCKLGQLDGNENLVDGSEKYYYRAGELPQMDRFLRNDGSYSDNIPWKPSIHMPREAARIFLRVKNVRVERLQDITEEGADAEGFGGDYPSSAFPNHKGSTGWYDGGISIVECFTELWDSIYAKRGYGWEVNPWVWVVEFERVVANA